MRSLIEMLEDERALMQKLESVYRYLLRGDDPEVIDILASRKEIAIRDLDKVRNEIREYVAELFE